MRRDPRYRFLINDNPVRLEVHDLDNEKYGPFECQINEIRKLRYLVSTQESNLVAWLSENSSYDACAYCLSQYNTG